MPGFGFPLAAGLTSGTSSPPTALILAPLTGIIYPNDLVQVQASPNGGDAVVNVVITARFALLSLSEVAFDGMRFTANYSGPLNTVTVDALGNWNFVLIRSGGWPSALAVDLTVTNASGGHN